MPCLSLLSQQKANTIIGLVKVAKTIITEEQKLSKIKNLLYKMHKRGDIWPDVNRKWHKKDS